MTPKKPTDFLDLARELRHEILLQTYNVTGVTEVSWKHLHEEWNVRGHKKKIAEWIADLQKVNVDAQYREDLESVKHTWLKELEKLKLAYEQSLQSRWAHLFEPWQGIE